MGGNGETHGKCLTQQLALSCQISNPAPKQGHAQVIQLKGHQKLFVWCETASPASCAWPSPFGWIFPSKKSEADIQHGKNHLKMFGKALAD